ncbi:MAG: nitrous oxide reductase accessory protein NosL [Phycisphaerales bacterium]|nr:nitrous oxide reductase accessory protein NosL [Phycisphaerales bacterium]
MNAGWPAIAAVALLAPLAACDRTTPDGPPRVLLGESVCEYCNMIISDDRWATSTIVDGPRGPDPRLFDDFNCQVDYEAAHPEPRMLARWSHCHKTREWLRTEHGTFLLSPRLRTPMSSKVAAFATASDAEASKAELTGELMDFASLWERLGSTGSGGHSPGAASSESGDASDESP